MKERVDSAKMVRDPTVKGPASQEGALAGGGGGVTNNKMEVEVKAEVKDEDGGRRSTDSRPPSNKLPNGDSGDNNTVSLKTEDNNNKRIKLEKKSESVKAENGKPSSVGLSDSQKSSPQQAGTPQHPSSGANTPATMMPQPHHGIVTSLDPPFMQQQSEIFVFSTTLANQAAESVRHGHCKSILQYHTDHPNTKAFLQKHPLKSAGSRSGMSHGMMGNMKGQPGPGMMRMQGPSPGNWGPPGMEDPSMMGPGGMVPNGPYPPNGTGPRMLGGWPGQGCTGPHPHGPHPGMGPGGYPPPPPGNMMDMEAEFMMSGGNHLNISSSQVPDENLTSEQRQHRSKSLAQLTKIHQMLMGGSGGGPQDGRQPPMSGGPGMYPGAGMMTSQQQAMMTSQQQAMMSQGGMMPPHGMMSPQHQHMMAQQGLPPFGPRGPGPGMSSKDQFQAQREWFQVQQEYYIEKQHRMQHMSGSRPPHMEPVPPPSYYSSISQKHGGMGGPTSPNMNGMRMPMGPHGPHGPHGPPPMGMDAEGMGMYGGPPDMCRPGPPMGMEGMPGMHGYPPQCGMPPQGPMDPGFDPTMAGAMPPGMGPGGPGGPRHHGPIPQGHMMGPNGMMGPMKAPTQVTLHRAGNPEQFNPETMGGVIPPVTGSSNSGSSSNSNKPPPSYAQAQKRKRDDLDDAYSKGNLQQTPSPTKIHYHLNQFEGQELTITKQLNSAFVGGSAADECTGGGVGGVAGGGHFNSHTNSPLHAPANSKSSGGPLSNSSQASAHLASPPVVSATGPSPLTAQPQTGGPHSGPLPSAGPSQSGGGPPHPSTSGPPSSSSGANMRLTHYDPAGGPPLTNGLGSGPHTPTNSKSAMSNITSASLANLAKGVENLSNQMQQNMMQGGPFHSIQVQGQMSSSNSGSGGGNNSSNSNSNNSIVASSGPAAAVTTSSGPVTSHPSSTQSQSTPSVNNTYIATNMSISQVNVPNHPSMNSYVNMQMQSMSSESTHMNMTQGPHGMPPGGGPMGPGPPHGMPGGPPMGPGPHPGPQPPPGMIAGGPRMSHHMTQSQSMMTSMGPSPGMPPVQGHPPSSVPAMNPGGAMPPHGGPSSSSMPPTPPAMSKGSQFTSPPLSHPAMTGSQTTPGVTSPPFPLTPSSNSSVQIQQKGHNTIQYLPANPPSSQQPPSATMKQQQQQQQQQQQRPDMEYPGMQRFASPMNNMEGKNPSSNLQYFPSASPGGPRPPMSSSLSAAAAMGPEFANQATIAMHHSAAMMRSSSIPDMQAIHAAPGPNGMPPSSMGPMENPGPMGGPSPMSGPPNSMMGGPDPMMGMSSAGPPMRPGHSPGAMRPMPPGMGPGSLECVSPIPGMGGYMNSGPSIEQAQAQAQAHAAMMMQGNTQMPVSSPHGPMPPGGPSPHLAQGPHGPMPGNSMHGSGIPPGSSPHGPPITGQSPHGGPPMPGQSPHGGPPMPGQSPHGGPPMPGQSPHGGPPMPGQSPHGGPPMPGQSPHGGPPMPGQSPHGPMPGQMPGPSPHGPMSGAMPHGPPHSSMAGPMPPHGHMGPMSGGPSMHGPGMPPCGMPRHPGVMRMGGPPMGPVSNPYGGMQYPQYQQDFYSSAQSRGPRQMMPGMMGGPPGQPYGMMPNMPGPS